MAKLTLAQWERHLFAAVDVLRGAVDAADSRDLVSVLLFLKRVNDRFEATREAIVREWLAAGDSAGDAEREAERQEPYIERGVLFVPQRARWEQLTGDVYDGAVARLQHALDALEAQDAALYGLFAHVDVRRTAVVEQRLTALIAHFDRIRLRDEDLEFPDMIGAAYEYLIKNFADSAGSKGGEFYTPRPVVRLMVELARPEPGMRVYDPCMGSGGMLLHAREYIDEHGEDPDDLLLAGQDANSGSWVMATMNMLFHGAKHFSLKTGDSLTNPLHPERDFDLALSNPPFSMNYRLSEIPGLPERMPYGLAPERGKADLMFVQHMLDMVKRRGGSVFTVVPHGVLFRGGREKEIRARMLEADLIEAVVGLAPNLFYGTGVPACVLVLRAPGRKVPARRGKVLFINADREFHAERARNVLLPEHIAKIASAFHAFEDVEGFARVVSSEELRDSDSNLTIRRYVDSTPPPERQDIKAYMEGGVPVVEIEDSRSLLDAYGIEVADLFAVRADDPAYVDFRPSDEQPDLAALAELAHGREQQLWVAVEDWWKAEAEQIAALLPTADDDRTEPGRKAQLAQLRRTMTESLVQRLLTVGLLDQYALGGAVIGWWHDVKNELKVLSATGFAGVVDGWVETVERMLVREGDPLTGRSSPRTVAERRQAYQHKAVAALVPEFLEELARAERTYADLTAEAAEAEKAQAQALAETPGELGEPDETGPSAAPAFDEAGRRALKRQRTEARKAITLLEEEFLARLEGARRALATVDGERDVVLDTLRNTLSSRLEELVAGRRQELVQAYERWQEKYRLSFREIDNQLSDGTVQNNPWSQRRAWNLTANSARTASGRQEIVAAVHELIDAEKTVEGALAKLEFAALWGPLALLDPSAAGEDGAARRPLRDVLVSAQGGNWARARESDGGIPVIGLGNLSAGGIHLDPSRLRRIDLGSARQAGALLEPGDVLLAAVRTDHGFRAAVWQGQLALATFGAQVIRLRPRADLLSSDYLAAWLRLPRAQDRIYEVARTSVNDMTVLNAARLLDVEMELPSRVDQREFEKQAETLHEQQRVRQRQLAKLRRHPLSERDLLVRGGRA
ncbi:N-6 DNA methylase [Streptomyces sp. F001]|uniref:N-6 DNA methylase n=1 Tax=Streptomyces sp. F001 TaxID=1510026 RepID=UPI0013EE6696|nr:N-6 DNA methylase [Streptomyces sp. F001]